MDLGFRPVEGLFRLCLGLLPGKGRVKAVGGRAYPVGYDAALWLNRSPYRARARSKPLGSLTPPFRAL